MRVVDDIYIHTADGKKHGPLVVAEDEIMAMPAKCQVNWLRMLEGLPPVDREGVTISLE